MTQKDFRDIINYLNIYFYKTIASHFDSSRQYFWPGFTSLKNHLPADFKSLRVLDLGCGNGRFGEFLESQNLLQSYTGLDSDPSLIQEAKQRYPQLTFKHQDILLSDLGFDNQFDLSVSFGVMHHLATNQSRLDFLESITRATISEGLVCVSFWKFLDIDPKAKRVVFEPGKKVDSVVLNYLQKFKLETGLQFDLDEFFGSFKAGDYLLSWKRGGFGIRFAHDYTKSEIENLFSLSSLKIKASWLADGPGDRGNQYYLLQSC
jgi:tRNA (uracil-5-)-methyltransferase TRM9